MCYENNCIDIKNANIKELINSAYDYLLIKKVDLALKLADIAISLTP